MRSFPAIQAGRFRLASILAAALFSAAPLLIASGNGWTASQYTPKQIEVYAQYVGKTYWVVEEAGTPAFHTAPSSAAPSFRPGLKESFEINEIVGGTAQIPAHYYRVTFESGKQGFIPIGSFTQQLNAAFVTVDPDRDAKAKLAKETETEKKRQEWIQTRSWPEHVKQAALKKQPVLGMSTKEATAILGKPQRVVRIKNTNLLLGKQEQWTYEGGSVLTFTNGLLTRIQPAENTTPPSASQPR
jgi:hypothetical protein